MYTQNRLFVKEAVSSVDKSNQFTWENIFEPMQFFTRKSYYFETNSVIYRSLQ